MNNTIPSNWKYNSSMENLYLFFQASKEKLSFFSPDTYRLTVHNALTLCYEAKEIYGLLDERNAIRKYYSKYIPIIIDELIDALHGDDILKNVLGMRLESVVTGFLSAKKDSALLIRWINMVTHLCDLETYINLCKDKIIEIVISQNKDKEKLLKIINDYYVSLINIGYDEEFLYQSLIHYFNKKTTTIDSPQLINGFLDKFDYRFKDIELYLIADTYLLDVFTEIEPKLKEVFSISKLEESTIISCVSKSKVLKTFYENYKSRNNRENLYIIAYKTKALDPYSALQELESYFELVQTINGYYKHKAEQRVYFDVIEKLADTRFHPIHLRRTIPNRPYIQNSILEEKIKTIIRAEYLSKRASISLYSALNKHFDAISCKNHDTMLRGFWTALEALFYESALGGERENSINAVLQIIDKTYMLKIMRTIYAQLINAISSGGLEAIGITSFETFIEYFSTHDQDSEGFKEISKLLANNPLLRFRLYSLRKELSDSKHIKKKIEKHHERIEWQLYRIYRARNLSTHIGITMPYMREILFNLHNYFDYVVNYVICKMECQEYVESISSVVFEAKNDNQIYAEYLKKDNKLSDKNYSLLLFGPDNKMMQYGFEIADFENDEKQLDEISIMTGTD